MVSEDWHRRAVKIDISENKAAKPLRGMKELRTRSCGLGVADDGGREAEGNEGGGSNVFVVLPAWCCIGP